MTRSLSSRPKGLRHALLRRLDAWIDRQAARPAANARSFLSEVGAVSIEFAIIVTLLFMLLFGIIVYGFYFGTVIAVNHAASEGARAAVAGLNNSERTTLATQTVTQVLTSFEPFLDVSAATVSAVPASGNPDLFEVSVSYDISQFSFNLYGGIIPVPTTNPTITVTVSNGGY